MIWGAGGGIGRALVAALAEQDWRIVAVGRDVETLEEADVAISVDNVANAAQVARAIYEAQFEIDTVDLWVYTAGDIVQARIDELAADDWQRIIDANLTGAFTTTSASLVLLAEDASLFFLGAISERLRLPGLSAYASAKAGLEAYVTTLAKEQRKRKVTIVRPGAVDTDFWDKVSLSKPRQIAPPAKIAAKIIEAYEGGYQGTLDLT